MCVVMFVFLWFLAVLQRLETVVRGFCLWFWRFCNVWKPWYEGFACGLAVLQRLETVVRGKKKKHHIPMVCLSSCGKSIWFMKEEGGGCCCLGQKEVMGVRMLMDCVFLPLLLCTIVDILPLPFYCCVIASCSFRLSLHGGCEFLLGFVRWGYSQWY